MCNAFTPEKLQVGSISHFGVAWGCLRVCMEMNVSLSRGCCPDPGALEERKVEEGLWGLSSAWNGMRENNLVFLSWNSWSVEVSSAGDGFSLMPERRQHFQGNPSCLHSSGRFLQLQLHHKAQANTCLFVLDRHLAWLSDFKGTLNMGLPKGQCTIYIRPRRNAFQSYSTYILLAVKCIKYQLCLYLFKPMGKKIPNHHQMYQKSDQITKSALAFSSQSLVGWEGTWSGFTFQASLSCPLAALYIEASLPLCKDRSVNSQVGS